ncbi:hypothetical protein BDZ90DRAFT_276289 [Jaminaea rosea]|uniref:Helicase C-terminal domain-containing protein n=1 Tax=Jaminaea rosea TaxID=1569628 RepID=A0A316UL24_9BASI|nr:hypothetical protein BDZ90DRAFT_276289 [Jaminaea rosea]PWN24623.1 hypothetical protein BDZ90DRAFT_276289 [Jaminaea rosea]
MVILSARDELPSTSIASAIATRSRRSRGNKRAPPTWFGSIHFRPCLHTHALTRRAARKWNGARTTETFSPHSSVALPPVSNTMSSSPGRPRPQRAAATARRPLVISDDEGSEDDLGGLGKSQTKRRRVSDDADDDSDFAEGSSSSDDEDDDDDDAVDHSDQDDETPSLARSGSGSCQPEDTDALETPSNEAEMPLLDPKPSPIGFPQVTIDLSNTPKHSNTLKQSSLASFFTKPGVAFSAASTSRTHPFFQSTSSRRANEKQRDSDFLADSDEDDDAFGKASSSKVKKGRVSGSARGGKLGVSGQKWAPDFRRGRSTKHIPHCPTEAQAAALAKEAEQKAKDHLWPPMSDLSEIYADIVDRMPEALLKPLAQTLAGKGRALRVATMCSGTESPLLALNLISRAVEAKWGIKMAIEHVFSCELEPFKQAYIERNFSPPLLFRDVTELGKPRAHTAYGALVEVPGDIDVLVAGTSCVDYSGLNNAKKAINEGGESGRTFFGMLDWVKRNQPAIVILENVKSAPWEGVGKFFEEADYDSSFSTRFDTKNYYIPQTRQRGYFFASRNKKGDYPANWHNLVSSLQRPASSPIEAFMLPTTDQRIQATRAKMGHEEAGKSRSTIDWSKCQGRHEEARGFEKLGQARPFTAWEEGGSCAMSHGAWNEFARPQPERVLDLMDITVLRDAKRGEDPHFKSRVWELSQNVDRNIVAPQPGITGCLTPSGMPFLTSRGGPVTGLEALSLQGLPINELLLTRESDDQLQNLAGNAMSSTVVGVCILAALVLARPDLEAERQGLDPKTSARLLHDIDAPRRRKEVDVIGSLVEEDYDLVSMEAIDFSKLLQQAASSSQLCICEGSNECKVDIWRCRHCDQTVCGTCKSRPLHSFAMDEAAAHRTLPRDFEDVLKKALPMRLAMRASGISRAAAGATGLGSEGKRWQERVEKVLNHAEFRFSHLIRGRIWTAEFFSLSSSRMELVLDPVEPFWQIFVEPDKREPEGSVLRKLLLQPVARQRIDIQGGRRATLLELGQKWELNLPTRNRATMNVVCHGEQIDSWQASMGIRGEYAGTKRYSKMTIEKVGDSASQAETTLCGEYELLPECGQANASLHKRKGGERPLYLFIDAARYGSSSDDAYVFSSKLGMLNYPKDRPVLASFKSGWKPPLAPRDPTVEDEVELTPDEFEKLSASYQRQRGEHKEKTQTVETTLCGQWVPCAGLIMGPYHEEKSATIAIPSSQLHLNLEKAGCSEAQTVLACTTSLSDRSNDDSGNVWPRARGRWVEVDLEHQGRQTFEKLSWLIERVPEVRSWANWMQAKRTYTASCCIECAPAPPSIQWLKKGNTLPIPIENEREAGPYEQAMKNRPFPFLLHLRTDDDGCGRLRLAVNPATLMHRALSRLPQRGDAQQPTPSWRLTRVDPTLTPFNLPKYELRSNRHDPEAEDPQHFKLSLRKEQKRSLNWMLAQEGDVEPFTEEEVSEASLPALEWCAEGMARQSRVVRGGVIADAVGYGKTAISLALIAKQREQGASPPPANPSLIPTKATLVIVPPQLCKQWENEVRKFVGSKLSVHVIFSKADLNKTTIERLQRVDIVIMSVSVYKSDSYFDSLAAFAAANPIPQREGRFFDSALAKSISCLPERVKELQLDDRGRTLWQSIKERKGFDPAHLTTYKAKKRVVGKQYAREKALEGGDDEEDGGVEDAWEQIKREKVSDVWGIKTGLKRWTDMTSPPLESFSWRRVIIDEFHYIAAEAGRVFSAVRSLTASSTWVLSGTPKTGDFADIRSMAAFLNVHLGVEDDADYADSSSRSRTSRNKARSNVERFRSFVEVHSPAWHHRRQRIGQSFLDRFVRQNVAEIDEIASIEVLKPIRMPAAERACYLELQHTIEALDLRHARSLFRGPARAKVLASENDRDHRLRTTLGESSSPEEALSRQAAHFVLSQRERAQNAIEACDLIIEERAKQLALCKEELAEKLAAAKEQHFLMALHYGYRDDAKQALVSFAKNAISAKYGDRESKQAVAEILEAANCLEASLTASVGRKQYGAKELKEALKRRAAAAAVDEVRKQRAAAAKRGGAKAKGRKRDDSEDEEGEDSDGLDDTALRAEEKEASVKAIKDLEAQLSKRGGSNDEERARLAWLQETHARALVHHLVQLRNETAARQRSLRYFENIRSIQMSQGHAVCGDCPGCKSQLTFANLALSSVCGHLFCLECGQREAWKGKCPESGCNADAKPTSIIAATSLGVENTKVSAFGEKMSQLAGLLRNERLIPAEDRIILFVQFEGLLEKTAQALTSYRIKFTRVKGNAKQRSQVLDDYQRGTAPRVLLLDVADESAAGSNLTIANHVIFLSSLISDDAATYRSTMEQARGRCLRFGQVKEVRVWHLLARSTIDEEVFERRDGRGTLDDVLAMRSARQEELGTQLGVESVVEQAAASAKGAVKV